MEELVLKNERSLDDNDGADCLSAALLEAAARTDGYSLYAAEWPAVFASPCLEAHTSTESIKRERTDDNDDDDESSSGDSPVHARRIVDNHKPPARRVKKRRRHELLRLRETVDALERDLRALERRQETTDSARMLSGMDVPRTWRHAAKRAIQEATRARLENAKLRASVDAHRAFAASLQETLRKPHRNAVVVTEDATPPTAVVRSASRADERSIYDRLRQNVTARSADVDAYMAAHGFAAMKLSSALFQLETAEATVVLNEHQHVCIDFVDRYILPFDFLAGAHVLWTHVLSKTLQFAGRSDTATLTEILTHTDDTLVVKQSANLDYLTDHEQLTTEYAVSKRIAKTDAVDFLWESLAESYSSSIDSSDSSDATFALPSVQLTQEGWVTIASVATPSGSTAASALQAYVRLTPSLVSATHSDEQSLPFCEDGVSQHPQTQLDAPLPLDVFEVAAHLIRIVQRNAAAIRCYVETTLLDNMRQASSAK